MYIQYIPRGGRYLIQSAVIAKVKWHPSFYSYNLGLKKHTAFFLPKTATLYTSVFLGSGEGSAPPHSEDIYSVGYCTYVFLGSGEGSALPPPTLILEDIYSILYYILYCSVQYILQGI